MQRSLSLLAVVVSGLFGCSSTDPTEALPSDGAGDAQTAAPGNAGGGSAGTGGAKGTGGSTGTGGAKATGTGGAKATGGATGTGGAVTVDAGAADVRVGSCDSLGPDGTWQNVGPADALQNTWAAISVAADPLQAGTLYAGFFRDSAGKGLWKSTDCGATWVNIATGRNGSPLESGDQWEVWVDPLNSDVYTDSGYGSWALYRSHNGGVDWDDLTPKGDGIPSMIGSFAIDPTNPKHILVSFHANCSGAYAPMCLGESTDGAATWRFVVGPTSGWGEGAGVDIVQGGTWLYGAPFGGLYYTKDSGATWEKTIDYPGCYSYVQGTDGTYYIGCLNMAVHKSTDAHTWTPLANSPQATAVALTGKYMFTSFQNDSTGVHRAPLLDLTAWNTVGPSMSGGASPRNIVYDAHHRVLYVASWGNGLWRVVTD